MADNVSKAIESVSRQETPQDPQDPQGPQDPDFVPGSVGDEPTDQPEPEMVAGLYSPEWIGEWIDLGSGVAITKPAVVVVAIDPVTQEVSGRELSSYWSHLNGEGEQCPGLGRIGYSTWVLQDESPTNFTVAGSLLCDNCGRHGWVREGRWVEA